jgi:hypothetical protein
MTHAWCHDTARDAAVRAAEDGRDRPLPTLEQCIARLSQIPWESAKRRNCEMTPPEQWQDLPAGPSVGREQWEREAASGGGGHFADASKMVKQPQGEA